MKIFTKCITRLQFDFQCKYTPAAHQGATIPQIPAQNWKWGHLYYIRTYAHGYAFRWCERHLASWARIFYASLIWMYRWFSGILFDCLKLNKRHRAVSIYKQMYRVMMSCIIGRCLTNPSKTMASVTLKLNYSKMHKYINV